MIRMWRSVVGTLSLPAVTLGVALSMASNMLGCGPATSAHDTVTPQTAAAPAAQAPPSSAPAGAMAVPAVAEPNDITHVIVRKPYIRMQDCGHDEAVGPLRCAFSAAGKPHPLRPENTLRSYVTEPPGMLLAAADWHPASKLDGEATMATCRFEKVGELTNVHLAAADNGVPGWLYSTTLPVGIVSECDFVAIRNENLMLSAAHLLLMHDGSKRRPASRSRSRQEALRLALDAERQLVGADFGEVARRLSDEPGAAERGGFLGNFSPQAMVPEFSLVLLATPIGARTPVFETSFGFHIAERRQPSN